MIARPVSRATSSAHAAEEPRIAPLNFACTMCGKCCHGLRLPLSLSEALQWANKGGAVELLADAMPQSDTSDYGPSPASYRQAQAFDGLSGAVAIDVSLTLVATFAGPCPFLRSDMSCGNYEARPRVCRVYPAEANPFRQIQPATKACPDDAWSSTQPILQRSGQVVPAGVRQAIQGMRFAAVTDTIGKARLADRLAIDTAAFANEGLAVHRPAAATLRAALEHVLSTDKPAGDPMPWRIVTNRYSTLVMLQEAGCVGIAASDDYIGFFPADDPSDDR